MTATPTPNGSTGTAAAPIVPVLPHPLEDKVRVLSNMVLDLYAQQMAMMDLMQSQGLGMPVGYIVQAKKKAREAVAGVCEAQGYDDTPDVQALKRVAVVLAK